MKIRVGILLVIGFVLCGCSDTEIYSRDNLLENGYTQFCGEYGVTYHTNESGYNIVYRPVGNNEFQKYFETETSSSLYSLDIYDGYLYFINKYDTSHLIYAYELDDEHDSIRWVPDRYIDSIREYFGKDKEYLYFSYYDKDKNLVYAKLSLDLQDFVDIEKEDIPKNLTSC